MKRPKYPFHHTVPIKAAISMKLILAGAVCAGSLPPGLSTAAQDLRVESDAAAAIVPYVSSDNLGVLYQDSHNRILERFGFSGEFQLQYASGESNHGSFGSKDIPARSRWEEIDVRRLRVGFLSEWFDVFKFYGNMDINPQLDPVYKDLYDLALTYAPNDAFNLSIGKSKARWFTQEYNTRTRELIVFEQALLVSTLVPQQLTGIWITGKADHWVYALAGFAGDNETAFSRFNRGAVIQSEVGYDFASELKVDTALVKFDYQKSSSPGNSNGPGKFSNAFSLNTTYQQGRFYACSDMLGAIGQGTQGDAWGVELTPTYFLIEHQLQLVLRYQFAHGDNAGLHLQSRYEGLASGMIATKGAGSDYNAAYLGLNYYIHGHNLKLMAGEEFNSMTGGKQNFNGWTTLLGLRASF